MMPLPRVCSGLRLVLIISLTAAGGGCKRAPTTVDEIIERNTEARGGRQAIEAVQSVAIDLDIVDPGFAVAGTYRATRPGKMRIDINADGKHVYTEAFDGQRGWQWKGKGTETVEESSKATAALRHGVERPGNLYGLHEMQARGHRVMLIGRERIDGVNYYALQLTLNDNSVTMLYMDPDSWLITRRRDFRALHVDVDPTPTTIEQRMSDFRKVAGVTFPFANTETDLKTGGILETTTLRSLTVNPSIDPRIFEQL
ncbi:MAG TPA: hypothetical protein VH207_00285 [Chthoniobacterales bacterium]|jgi:hypothetical protein|nr:hypothetical protein [Chthoniobacterales bacterium]